MKENLISFFLIFNGETHWEKISMGGPKSYKV